MKRRAILSTILCVSVIFYGLFFANVPQTRAIPTAIANLIPEIGSVITEVTSTLTEIDSYTSQIEEYAKKAKEAINTVLGAKSIAVAKVLALFAVQKAVALFIGDGGDGNGLLIRDYNNYLYISPQQRAMEQMNSFFNTVSKGRLSYFNYEGIGPNYDSYLVTQAKKSISGTPFVTNIQEQVTDPSSQIFSGGNMKGIMTLMQCANNVACYSLVAGSQYEKEFTKAQDIARSEQQNGFLPTKASSGRITKPAALAQNALMQVDQVGTQLIMNAADPTGKDALSALGQIAEGAAISIGARAINYGISDDAGKAAIRNQNEQFPFSIGYSSLKGVNIGAGGVKINTNLGSIGTGGCTTIGNTQACQNVDLNAAGGQVTTTTKKVGY